jgi:endonuclease III
MPARKRVRFVPPRERAKGATAPERVERVVEILEHEYAEATTALDHESPYELLAATILSAQCTDARVNMVTPALFAEYPTPAKLAKAKLPELEEIIRSTGFFHAKAKNLVGMAQALVERHGGEVPTTLLELTALPGVGRKTANVVRGTLFHQQAIIVDTHCSRIARRLGWTRNEDPVKIEQDLMKVIPADRWTDVSHSLVLHGRAICHARKPQCTRCPLGEELCPSFMLEA